MISLFSFFFELDCLIVIYCFLNKASKSGLLALWFVDEMTTSTLNWNSKLEADSFLVFHLLVLTFNIYHSLQKTAQIIEKNVTKGNEVAIEDKLTNKSRERQRGH